MRSTPASMCEQSNSITLPLIYFLRLLFSIALVIATSKRVLLRLHFARCYQRHTFVMYVKVYNCTCTWSCTWRVSNVIYSCIQMMNGHLLMVCLWTDRRCGREIPSQCRSRSMRTSIGSSPTRSTSRATTCTTAPTRRSTSRRSSTCPTTNLVRDASWHVSSSHCFLATGQCRILWYDGRVRLN